MTDARQIYGDIIDLPHHRPQRHAPMPPAERAAQFSAFAALSGHGEAIRATARHAAEKMEDIITNDEEFGIDLSSS